MKHLMPGIGLEQDRRFYAIRRGMMDGCELYLSKQERFPLQTGIFEREIRSRFANMAADARLFLDVGAAEGFFSIYMLRNTEAKVFAFEPEDDFGDVLLRNIERNTRDGHRVAFRDHIAGPGESASEEMTIDRAAANQKGPVLLKIDAEGEELEILENARETLSRDNTRVMVRVHEKPTESRCMNLLDEHDFNVEIVGPAWWRALVRDRHTSEDHHWLIAEKSHIDGLFS